MEVLTFNKWSTEGIKVEDKGLVRYMCLDPVIVPKTGARTAGTRFHKAKVFIVERLINKVMVAGHKGKKHFKSSGYNVGKKYTAYAMIEKVFERVELKTKQNPIAVLVKAIENAAPREEIITIEYGGARYPKAVECAPIRRIDLVLRLFVQGAYHKSFNSKRSFVDTLTDEIVFAFNSDAKSGAIAKKNELERQADGSR